MRLLICVLGAVAAVGIAADNTPFTKSLYPVLEDAGCRGCHVSDGVASATRLQFPETPVSAFRLEAFGKSLVRLVDQKTPANSLLLRKPTARVPHAGGQRIKPGTPEEAALIAWIDRLAALKGDELAAALRYREEDGSDRPTVGLRRLTHSQYNNTVRDLLDDRGLPANQFPPEDFVNGFKNQYEAENLSPLLQDAYSAAAEKLAARFFRNRDPRSFDLRAFGAKAFRRPLDESELRRYEALARKGGPQLAVEAMLQSPNFLFRLEDTANPKWRPYAAAARLSYALWDSMPDETLFFAAARGDLNTAAGVEKAARRMLDDGKARQALDEFVAQWLRFDRVLTATRERRAFPNFTPDTAIAMTQETRRFFSDLVWSDRNFTTLFTAPYAFPNGDLARIYGVEPPATDFERVDFPANSERAGLLGQAMFLTLSAKPDDTSPTARGLFVREQFLCQHVADPPPGVNTNLPPVTEAKPVTNRERLAIHTIDKTCSGCHNLVDPIGFGLEKFDAIGQRREKLKLTFNQQFGEGERRADRKVNTVELDLDTTGQVAGIPNSAFSSPKELGAVLAASPQCQECIVKQYFRYVAGRTETPGDRPLIRNVLADFKRSDFKFKEMIISMVRAREFPGQGGGNVAGNR